MIVAIWALKLSCSVISAGRCASQRYFHRLAPPSSCLQRPLFRLESLEYGRNVSPRSPLPLWSQSSCPDRPSHFAVPPLTTLAKLPHSPLIVVAAVPLSHDLLLPRLTFSLHARQSGESSRIVVDMHGLTRVVFLAMKRAQTVVREWSCNAAVDGSILLSFLLVFVLH